MVRKLAFAISLLSASYTGSALALGLGEATVKSNLNQPLKAEIELVSASEYGSEEILPGLATREEFLKANVDRVYFLSDMRFKVEKNSKGEPIIVLTTNKPVREPYLNFLVEVIWPSGRLLREYALLIDPPVFTKEKPTPVKVSQVRETFVSGDSVNIPDQQAVSVRAAANVNDATLGASYGPTNSNDTLWDIALKARPNRSVSPQQVMLAIQDLNPDAFISGNINKLKAGKVLRLPSLEQIRMRSKHAAIEEVIAQNENVRGKRSKTVATAQPTSTPPRSAAPVSTPAAKDELKLVVPESSGSEKEGAHSGTEDGRAGGSLAASSNELTLALEKLDKANIENSELNGRLNDLEEQLQTLQRLLTLKNDQLANIQAQMRAADMEKALSSEANASASVAEPVQGELVSDTPSTNDKAQTNTVENKAADETSVQAEASAATTQNDTAVEGVSETSAAPAKKPETVDSDVKTEAVADQSTKPSAAKSDNIVEMIFNNPLYLAIAIASIIGIVILLWFVSRNNAKREEEYQASLPVDEDDSSVFDDDEVSDGDEPFMSEDHLDETELDEELEEEFDNSDGADPSSSDEDEDVLAEADVYIAYGRLDQAASVLENAVTHDPVRTDYRLKLLSVYKESGDVEAFNRQFSELEAIQDQEALDQASVIRSEMLENDLVSLEDKEHSLELDRLEEEASKTQEIEESIIETEAEALEGEGQTFDFDSVELDESDADLEFDADALDVELDDALDAELQSVLEEEPNDEPVQEIAAGADELDLSDELDGVAEELSAELSEDDFDDSILDVDLDDIDMSEELDSETEIELPSDLTEEAIAESLAVDEVESGDGAGIVEAPASSEPTDDSLGDEDDFDFLEGTDEASTKLDLARAYIDMGDLEGAKDILEEVAAEGNDEQKAEATDLMSKLDV